MKKNGFSVSDMLITKIAHLLIKQRIKLFENEL